MITQSKEKASDMNKTEEREVIVVPEGTFAGAIEKPILVKEGQPIPEDTGDQGGGQNWRTPGTLKKIRSSRSKALA
jgi:hypothetical protein